MIAIAGITILILLIGEIVPTLRGVAVLIEDTDAHEEHEESEEHHDHDGITNVRLIR